MMVDRWPRCIFSCLFVCLSVRLSGLVKLICYLGMDIVRYRGTNQGGTYLPW
jgi:hypothetical protein